MQGRGQVRDEGLRSRAEALLGGGERRPARQEAPLRDGVHGGDPLEGPAVCGVVPEERRGAPRAEQRARRGPAALQRLQPALPGPRPRPRPARPPRPAGRGHGQRARAQRLPEGRARRRRLEAAARHELFQLQGPLAVPRAQQVQRRPPLGRAAPARIRRDAALALGRRPQARRPEGSVAVGADAHAHQIRQLLLAAHSRGGQQGRRRDRRRRPDRRPAELSRRSVAGLAGERGLGDADVHAGPRGVGPDAGHGGVLVDAELGEGLLAELQDVRRGISAPQVYRWSGAWHTRTYNTVCRSW